MGTSPDVIDTAKRRLRRSLLLPAFCVLAALAAAASAAPNNHDQRSQPARSESRATPAPAPTAGRDETPRLAAVVDAKTAAAPSGAASADVAYWLAGGAVTLGVAALATAVLLARTQAKLDAEQERRRQIETKYLTLYNNSPNGFHTLDLDGAVTDINDTEVGWLGYTREQILGKRYAEFLAEDSSTPFPDAYAHLLRGERSTTSERQRRRIIGKDGGVRMLALSPSLIRDAHGRVVETFWTAVDVSETARLEQALDSEAHFDRVTNAHNRAFFFTLGEREIARMRRSGGQLALLYVDIDDFKQTNALYGHFAGDRVLRTVCGLIGAALRNVDIFARVGDDEFAVLLPDVGHEGAMVVVDRLLRSLAATPVKLTSNDSIEIRAAIGVGVCSASTQTLDALLLEGQRDLERARQAMRAADPAPDTAASLAALAKLATPAAPAT
jgi:two-component system, cell cycle response regulator